MTLLPKIMAKKLRSLLIPGATIVVALIGLSCDPHDFDNTKNFYQPHGGGHGGAHDGDADQHGSKEGENHKSDQAQGDDPEHVTTDADAHTGDEAHTKKADQAAGKREPNVLPE